MMISKEAIIQHMKSGKILKISYLNRTCEKKIIFSPICEFNENTGWVKLAGDLNIPQNLLLGIEVIDSTQKDL
jgi:hypothetical protein